jgi:thiol-disulfide isomerase/thioredoxin
VTSLGHHFNEQSPNSVEVKKEKAKLNIQGSLLTAIWANNQKLCEDFSAKLYICDDKKTYCVEKRQKFKCENKELVAENDFSPKVGGSKVLVVTKHHEEDGFLLNKPIEAFNAAKEKNKPVMIDFFGYWCPPCNQLDEEVFPSAEFKKIAKDFILLRLDVDTPVSWNLKSKYKIKGYPTLVFTDAKGDEIRRILGAREKNVLVEEMKLVLKAKDKTEVSLKERADKEDAKAAYELGMILLGREEFADAQVYLMKASQGWKGKDPRQDDLLEAQLGVASRGTTPEAKKAYVGMLKFALETQKKSSRIIERSILHAAGVKETEGPAVAKQASLSLISTIKERLKNPALLKKTEWTRGDLYTVIAENYEAIEDLPEAKKAYAQAAWEFGQAIKKAGLNFSGKTEGWAESAVEVLKTSFDTLVEGADAFKTFSDDLFTVWPESQEVLLWPTTKGVLSAWKKALEAEKSRLSTDDFLRLQKSIQESCKVKGKELFMALRVAVLGKPHGYELKLFVPLLTKESLLLRVNSVLEKLNQDER